MKKITLITKMIAAAALLVVTLGITSCIEENFPEDNIATKEQIGTSDNALQALRNSTVGYINEYNSYSRDLNYYSAYSFDFGYSAFGIMRDVVHHLLQPVRDGPEQGHRTQSRPLERHLALERTVTPPKAHVAEPHIAERRPAPTVCGTPLLHFRGWKNHPLALCDHP